MTRVLVRGTGDAERLACEDGSRDQLRAKEHRESPEATAIRKKQGGLFPESRQSQPAPVTPRLQVRRRRNPLF